MKDQSFESIDVIHVIAAVIKRDGHYLLCQRPVHKRHGGLWEFPGGKLEPGEDHLQAARRELQEELGIGVKRVGEILGSVRDPGSPYVIDFIEVVITGEPVCHEHTQLAWLTLPEMLGVDLAPSDAVFRQNLIKAQEPKGAAADCCEK